MSALSLDESYVVYIRSKEGKEVFRIEEKDMMYSGLMRAMFLDREMVVSTEGEPFVFSRICDENMGLIVGYIKKCVEDGEEMLAPPKPLPRVALPDILGSDYEVIRSVMESKEVEGEKLARLAKLVMDVTYLDMVELREKVCVAIASMFIGKRLEAIKTMVSCVERGE